MAIILENKDRNVIPRWRPFVTTAGMGELSSPAVATQKVMIAHDLSQLLNDWSENSSISYAGDLISASIVSNNYDLARNAAQFVLEHPETAPKPLYSLAQSILLGRHPTSLPDFSDSPESNTSRRDVRITQIRNLLNEYQSNGVLWMDLAHRYAVLGLSEKAERAIRVSLGLAPNNRFVLRSAARFFIHRDRLDIALDILRHSERSKSDPWIIAAEIATALSAHRMPWHIREGQSILSSKNFLPLHLSELSSALGTHEFLAGSPSKAKKLFRNSLIAPNDNSLAQAEWISHSFFSLRTDVEGSEHDIERAYEANAIKALREAQWDEAYKSALGWMKDQPFSGRPPRLASFLAAAIFEDHEAAVEIAKIGLIASPGDVGLNTSLVYSYASMNQLTEATRILTSIDPKSPEDWVQTAIDANLGLIAFRNGDVARGRFFYSSAVNRAAAIKKRSLQVVALINWAHEELYLNESKSEKLFDEASNIKGDDLGPDIQFRLDRLRGILHKRNARARSSDPSRMP